MKGDFFMNAIQLGQAIHEKTDYRCFLSRFYHSFIDISKEKGWAKGVLSASALTVVNIYAATFAYPCLEGSVRSIMEVIEDDTYIVRIRPFGDVGGWTALALFAAMTIGTLSVRFIREGEFIRLKSICKKWIGDNQKMIEENPNLYNILYEKISEFYTAFNSQCLFSKSLVSRQLTVLDILSDAPSTEKNSTLSTDRALQEIYQNVKDEIEEASSLKKYFHRLYKGQKAIKKEGGCSRMLGSLILGVALPIIFLLCAALSFVGEFGLGKELFVDREELTDIGHFGEWPFNAVEVITVAFFLHIWCMINPGDFARTRKIYARHINSLKDDNLNFHDRLCDTANEALSQMSPGCHFFKLPSDYQFEKLNYEK